MTLASSATVIATIAGGGSLGRAAAGGRRLVALARGEHVDDTPRSEPPDHEPPGHALYGRPTAHATLTLSPVSVAHEMLTQLRAARADASYDRKLLRSTSAELLVIDDLGLRPLTGEEPIDLYEVVRRRYERASTIITSNRALPEWAAPRSTASCTTATSWRSRKDRGGNGRSSVIRDGGP